jgi:hypothetical protein
MRRGSKRRFCETDRSFKHLFGSLVFQKMLFLKKHLILAKSPLLNPCFEKSRMHDDQQFDHALTKHKIGQ